MSGFGDLYDDVYWTHDMYTLEMYDLYPLRLLRIYICMLKFIFVDDVASISWIYTLFACFIALIEIGRYKLHLSLLFIYQIEEFF